MSHIENICYLHLKVLQFYMYLSFATQLTTGCLWEVPPSLGLFTSPDMAFPVHVVGILQYSLAHVMAITVVFAASIAACVTAFCIASES